MNKVKHKKTTKLDKAVFTPLFFKRCLHTVVSVTILLSLISAAIFIYLSKRQFYENEFLAHGIKYVVFLLSVWVSACQVIFFSIYSAIDIIDLYFKKNVQLVYTKNILHRTASYLLFTVVFPLSSLVSTLFWTFYFWNRDVVYPEFMDDIFPPILNHIMHTLPAIFAVIYMKTSNKINPPKSNTLAGLLAFISIYTVCLIAIRIRDGRWVYIAIESLTTVQLSCTFLLCLTGAIIYLFLGHFINDKIKG